MRYGRVKRHRYALRNLWQCKTKYTSPTHPSRGQTRVARVTMPVVIRFGLSTQTTVVAMENSALVIVVKQTTCTNNTI